MRLAKVAVQVDGVEGEEDFKLGTEVRVESDDVRLAAVEAIMEALMPIAASAGVEPQKLIRVQIKKLGREWSD
jgi:hypothetical protein